MKNDLSMFKAFIKPSHQITKPTTTNSVIYTRVSTKEQADTNMSLETQRKICEQYANKNGYIILESFGGTYESAKNDERKEFSKMLAFVKKSKEKISYIIVYSVDRFSRSGANAIYLKEQLRGQGVHILAVTQPSDTATPSGSLQQNIQFIFSEYDNQLRREKCMSGVKEALLRGEWCHRPPSGYDSIKRNGQRVLVVNEIGKLLRKAFLWKANEGLSTEEIKSRLAKMGAKMWHQKLSYIFRNPFYCGILAHAALDGEPIEGTHEKLISKEIFLKVNDVLKENTQGYSCNYDNANIPLKNFLKCGHCGSNLPGYIVKKKNLWYYKCRKKGCGNNKSANELHALFTEVLSSFTFSKKYNKVIQEQVIRTYHKNTKENKDNSESHKKQLDAIQTKLERLEERHITEEISSEMFTKYQAKFKTEAAEIQKLLHQSAGLVSNPNNVCEIALKYSTNLNEMWLSGEYQDKQRLQYLLFPDGLVYDKKKDSCRTQRIDSTFLGILLKSQVLEQKKIGIPALGLRYSDLVENIGFEPITSSLPAKRSSQMS
jgi:site-specific DNA recombinase